MEKEREDRFDLIISRLDMRLKVSDWIFTSKNSHLSSLSFHLILYSLTAQLKNGKKNNKKGRLYDSVIKLFNSLI